MTRIAFVNGAYRRHADARVHIEDRGYQFGDGVYEVCEIRDGALIDEKPHLARLERSLAALRIAAPVGLAALKLIMREVIRRNRVRDGLVYIQITRGVAPRDHGFPAAGRASLVVSAKPVDRRKGEANASSGVRVVALPDERWRRPQIKSLQLLPNVLAKQAAREKGAYEAWLVDDRGRITEGSSTNAWIVDAAGKLATRQADRAILSGVTRATLLALLAKEGVAFEERPFTLEETYAAREAFLTSAGNGVMPVVAVDDRVIGDGRPGAITLALREKFHRFAEISPA
ncbi:MAG TPA: D-amino-acid transaminase [Roseiarcus sp.]|nr:D-amino-acid transaminase [Roseiarcus sp.]